MKNLRMQVNIRIIKENDSMYDGALSYETSFIFPGASFDELAGIIERFNVLAESIAAERSAPAKKD